MIGIQLPLAQPARIVVDQLLATPTSSRWPYAIGCHLFHLDGDLQALDAFARFIGLRRHWRHDAPGFVHYDLTADRRQVAIHWGARELPHRDPEYIAFLLARRDRIAAGVIIDERA